MDSTENLQKTSLILFIIVGLTHILSGLFVANGYLIRESNLVNQILDIPFLVIGLTYLGSSIKLGLQKTSKYPESLDAIMIIIGIIIILAVIGINLFFPNV